MERLALELTDSDRDRALRALLEEEIWPSLPVEMLGRAPSAEEQDEILGYGPEA